MHILAFRMEAYQLAFEFIRLGHGCTLSQTEDPASVREIVDRQRVDMFLIGYLRDGRRDCFEILKSFRRDPILAKVPVTLIIGIGEGSISHDRFQLARGSFGNPMFPIFYPGDLVPQYLYKALGEYVQRNAVPRPRPPLVAPFRNEVVIRAGSGLSMSETSADELKAA